MKKVLISVLALVLVAVLSVGATLAFLQDEDGAVNVMTVGNVKIAQHEQQRVEKNGEFSSELESFKQGKLLMPVTTPGGRTEDTVKIGGRDIVLPDEKTSYIDKIVTVSNEGMLPAYVRTLVAVPTGGAAWEQTPVADADAWLHCDMPDGYDTYWTLNSTAVFTEIDGQGYYIWEFVLNEALMAGETTYPMIRGFYMDERVNNDDDGFFMGNKRIEDVKFDETVDVLVMTQAVQTSGFSDAQSALDKAFYDITATNHPWTDEIFTNVSTAEELSTALTAGGNVILSADIEMDGDNTITIPQNVNTVLHLAGKNITAVSDQTGANRNALDVRGTLTITGNGIVSIKHTGANMGWSNSTNVANVTGGGVLNVLNGAQLINYGGSDMAFAVHLNNWGKVTLNADKALLKSTYCAIRVFNSGYDMNTVKVTNSTIQADNMAFWVHNYTAADFGAAYDAAAVEARLNIDIKNGTNTIIGKIRYGFTNATVDEEGVFAPANSDVKLTEALAAGKDVMMTDDVATVATTTAPYGNKVGFVHNGGVLDGGNNELYVDVSGDAYGIMTSGGTIQNLTMTSGCRAIVIMEPTQDVNIHNAHISGDDILYPLNTAEHAKVSGLKLTVTDSSFGGWASFDGGFESASFTGCDFVEGSYGYGWPYESLVKPYINTTFTECDFAEKYYVDLSSLGAGCKVVFEDCTVGGVALTESMIGTNCDGTETICVELPGGRTLADCVVIQ